MRVVGGSEGAWEPLPAPALDCRRAATDRLVGWVRAHMRLRFLIPPCSWRGRSRAKRAAEAPAQQHTYTLDDTAATQAKRPRGSHDEAESPSLAAHIRNHSDSDGEQAAAPLEDCTRTTSAPLLGEVVECESLHERPHGLGRDLDPPAAASSQHYGTSQHGLATVADSVGSLLLDSATEDMTGTEHDERESGCAAPAGKRADSQGSMDLLDLLDDSHDDSSCGQARAMPTSADGEQQTQMMDEMQGDATSTLVVTAAAAAAAAAPRVSKLRLRARDSRSPPDTFSAVPAKKSASVRSQQHTKQLAPRSALSVATATGGSAHGTQDLGEQDTEPEEADSTCEEDEEDGEASIGGERLLGWGDGASRFNPGKASLGAWLALDVGRTHETGCTAIWECRERVYGTTDADTTVRHSC